MPVAAPALLILFLAASWGASPARAAPDPVSITGRLEGLGILRFEHDSPRQKPLGRLELSAQQRWTRRLSWKISAVGRIGGPPVGAQTGAFVFDRSFQNYAPSLELGEAWLAYERRVAKTFRTSVRLGTQKFRWGVLDVVSPNDQLNPREFEDPFLTDEIDRKIAVPALTLHLEARRTFADWRTSNFEISLVWQPIAVPWRFPLPGERWFAPAALAPDVVAVGAVPGTPCPCELPVTQIARNSAAPARRFDNGNAGIRIGATTADVDWHVMLYDGYDPAPAFDSDIRLDGRLDAPRIDTELRPAYFRYPTIGADFETSTAFDLVVRGEAAFKFQRPWSFEISRITDEIAGDPSAVATLLQGGTLTVPTYVLRDAVEWGLGADRYFGDTFALFELYQILLFNNDVPLLVRNVDTRLTARAETPWLDERLVTELIATWGIEAGYGLARARASYSLTDHVRLELGVLGIWGSRDSLVGQYEQNSEAFGRVSYTF